MALAAELARALADAWSIRPGAGAPQPVEGYQCTHWIFTPDGSEQAVFVKSIPVSSMRADVLSAQLETMAALRHSSTRSNSYVHLPAPQPTSGGQLFLTTEINGLEVHVLVFPAVQGVLLHDFLLAPMVGADAEAQAQAAVTAFAGMLGRLSRSLLSIAAPASDSVMASHVGLWDLQHASQHIATAKRLVAEGSLRPAAASLVISALEKGVAALMAASQPGSDVRRSWIHGDAHDMNVLIRHTEESSCGSTGSSTGTDSGVQLTPLHLTLIDTDDCAYSYTVCEVAIALTYLLLLPGSHVSRVIDMGSRFLRSFAAVCPLSASEIRLLLPLIRARLATSLVLSSATAAEARAQGKLAPEKEEYLLVHAAPAASLLQLLQAADAEEAATTAWAAAAAEGAAAGAAAGEGRVATYVPHTLESMGAEQRAVSEGVRAVLVRWGCGDSKIGKVIDVPLPTATSGSAEAAKQAEAAAVASGKAGTLPTTITEGWSTASPAAAAAARAAWPSAPFVYDFTGEANAALASVTGTDPAKLAAFTDMMFAPLMEQSAESAAAASSSVSASAGAAARGPYAGRLARIGWGRYGEDRILYTSEHFTGGGAVDARTMHMGVDLEAPPYTPLYCPLPGRIHSWARNTAELDYGPTIIVEHEVPAPDGSGKLLRFTTLYGHLSVSSILQADGSPRYLPGEAVTAGQLLAWIGDSDVNGGWPPHTHFQIQTELGMGGWCGDYPGVCTRSSWPAYKLLCLDPNLILRCPYVQPIGWSPE